MGESAGAQTLLTQRHILETPAETRHGGVIACLGGSRGTAQRARDAGRGLTCPARDRQPIRPSIFRASFASSEDSPPTSCVLSVTSTVL